MNAQVSFLEGTINLIHIPLPLYSSFLEPILKVLLPQTRPSVSSDSFINISITPLECSIVCNSVYARQIFESSSTTTISSGGGGATISKDEYAVLSFTSAGMDAGSRVADLTSPLALAKIPIFFITTYYADFILVPVNSISTVVKTLLARGFVFSDDLDDGAVFTTSHSRSSSHTSIVSREEQPPSTPPPSSILELQEKTFVTLKKRGVLPFIEEDLTLIQCSGREITEIPVRGGRPFRNGSTSSSSSPKNSLGQLWLDTVDTRLYTALVAALVSKPRFLSLTLAKGDPPSMLMDKRLLGIFGDTVVGPGTEIEGEEKGGGLVPIFLDLNDLPLEVTGIVSGVAGRLMRDGTGDGGDNEGGDDLELSYLSTARAGAVILGAERSRRALKVLMPLLSD
ncbi:hypothetical protein QBC38DRAFT_456786 [Podospora fimiseda]|uniref:CASTOR ACT domain-containing protein n=1 Tax=Podospora fimiseda TaxID=252190 RepID=A0AAN7BM73_9PEZI|nr:hypothetical protein QBC38DRAFT_456786 [Podospora fimiseda]